MYPVLFEYVPMFSMLKVKPLCTGIDKHAEELKKLEAEMKVLEQNFAKEEEARKQIEVSFRSLR